MGNLKGRKLKENKRSGVPTRATESLGVARVHWKFLRVSFHTGQDCRADCGITSPLQFSRTINLSNILASSQRDEGNRNIKKILKKKSSRATVLSFVVEQENDETISLGDY